MSACGETGAYLVKDVVLRQPLTPGEEPIEKLKQEFCTLTALCPTLAVAHVLAGAETCACDRGETDGGLVCVHRCE